MKATWLNITVIGVLPLALIACASNLPDAVNKNTATQASTTTTAPTIAPSLPDASTATSVTTSLSLRSSNTSPGVNTSITLIAAGGTPGYTYSLVIGSGTLNGATYITPGMGETATFQVADAAGNIAPLSVTVNGPTLKQINRYYVNGTHFFTDPTDGYVAGITPDGPAYKVLLNSSGDSTTKPLYRCVIPNTARYFETDQSNCEGQWQNATLGYVYTTQVAGTVPLYRYTGGNCGADHIDDLNGADPAVGGCHQEGPFGFVPAP